MENHYSRIFNHNHQSKLPLKFVDEPALTPLDYPRDDGNVREFISMLRRRSLIIIGVTTAVMITFVLNMKLSQQTPEYEGNFRLLVEPVNEDNKALEIIKETNTGQTNLDYESQIQVLKSPEIMGSIIKKVQVRYPDINYDFLLKYLKITRLNETKIIQVSYRSQDSQQVKFVLDTIAKDYIKYSSEKRQSKLSQGINFVEKKLPSIQKQVDSIQQELQTFRQKYDFFDPENQGSQIAIQFNSLSEQRQKIEQELAQARANFTSLKQKDGEIAALNNAALYQQLLIQVHQLDTQISSESSRLQPENPTIQTLQEKRESLLPLLNQESQRFLNVKFAEILTQVQALEFQSQQLAKIEKILEQKRKQWPVLSRQYAELQRKLQTSTESLNRFLSIQENLQIQISQTKLGWQLIQAPGQPQKAIFVAGIARSLLLALGTSIVCGIGVALLLEKIDRTHHSIQTLKKQLKFPLLGNIPFEKQITNNQYRIFSKKIRKIKSKNTPSTIIPKLTVIPYQDYKNYSPEFLEALQVLYCNLQLLESDRSIHSLIISSAMPRDGKSTIALHLAQIATAMGRRVLLVDANLRQPIIHKLLGLNNSWGLSNLITSNLPVGETIQQLPTLNQLSVITAGAITSEPIKLLASSNMKQIMADFHDNFDLVIYDTPCLSGLADASFLASNTDGILLVVRIDKTDSTIIERALDHLKIASVNVLGVVSNGQKGNSHNY
ncbi:GumC family protein [Fortiea contorta]|uniref:GumC family protein n=1 Tax=Fortiea contorta TaxID=1892405 RepID=UPI000371DB96|nr:polysaccharide biosynthesis tyrosine autokinase [Fortiea contorta]